MLKQIKRSIIYLVLVGSLVFTGCSKEEKLEVTLTDYETRINEVMDVYKSISEDLNDDKTLEIINEQINVIDEIKEDLEKEMKKYDKSKDEEYELFDKLNESIENLEDCYEVLITILELGGIDSLTGVDLISLALKTGMYDALIQESLSEYNDYKKQLGLGEKIKNIEFEEKEKEKVNEEESKVEKQEDVEHKEAAVDEPKVETKVIEEPVQQTKSYCQWCETNTDHNSDNHIGMCYDCTEEMEASKMYYNGRSFHCGCENDTIECAYCGKSVIRKIAFYGSYCSEQCHDGLMVTYNCVECGKDIVLDINADARDLCDDCINKGSYDEQYDETGHATRCWNCGSSNISYFDDYNYSCNDCGDFTQ